MSAMVFLRDFCLYGWCKERKRLYLNTKILDCKNNVYKWQEKEHYGIYKIRVKRRRNKISNEVDTQK